jgi:hypothetical protein
MISNYYSLIKQHANRTEEKIVNRTRTWCNNTNKTSFGYTSRHYTPIRRQLFLLFCPISCNCFLNGMIFINEL